MLSRTHWHMWLKTAVLLLFFALGLRSLLVQSPTMDEQGFLVRGLGYVRGENQHMRVGHPLGLNAWNALLLRGDETVRLPVDDPSWAQTSFHQPGDLFLWGIGNHVERVMFQARVMTLFLGMVLCAVVGRWAAEASKSAWGGFVALALCALDPNILAHSGLVTTDLGLALGAAVAGYTLWRYSQRPTLAHIALFGLGLAVLNNTKFTAGLFLPFFGLLLLGVWWQRGVSLKTAGGHTAVLGASAFFSLWTMYGWQIGTLPHELPALPQLGGLTLPLAHHLEQLLDIGNRAQQGAPSFLMGEYRATGWWLYFPIAFALKTPLPTLVLVGQAVSRSVGQSFSRSVGQSFSRSVGQSFSRLVGGGGWVVVLPPLGYFAIALTTSVNLGYRHLLPILPFLFVLVGMGIGDRGLGIADWGLRIGGQLPITNYQFPMTLLLLTLALRTVTLAPHFLPFFNPLAGGPEGGWRYLVDSNMDWGQGLAGLAEWQRANEVDTLWLSYFGVARPSYYGLRYRGLDSYPPRYVLPGQNPLYPADPAPGVYAISATNLQGVHFQNRDQFGWFRQREPIAKIGYSLFIYDVPARGPTAALALPTGLDMATLPAPLFAPLNTNDVQPRWYNPATSLLWPAGGGWLVGEGTAVPPLAETAALTPIATAAPYTLYQSAPPAPPLAPPLADMGAMVLQAVTLLAMGEVHTVWQATADDNGRPLQFFVHALNEQGEIVGQSDVLDMAQWRAGDWLHQTHFFHPTTPPTHYRIGLYDTATGEQLGMWVTEEVRSEK